MRYIFVIPLIVVFTICTVALYFAFCMPALATGNSIAIENNMSLPGKHQFSLMQHGAIAR